MQIAKYSIMANGSSYGYFEGKKGIRQGDSISPYLFVLVMELFSYLLRNEVHKGNFILHYRCKDLMIIYLLQMPSLDSSMVIRILWKYLQGCFMISKSVQDLR